MANLIDSEIHDLALALAAALAANASPYRAPARIEMTAALVRGDYRAALDLRGSPTEADAGSEPAEQRWYELACALAEKLEDYALAASPASP